MKTIWKYPISPSDDMIKLSIPGGGPVLSAGLDPIGQICVWAAVDTEEEEEPINVYCVGTGWPLDWIFDYEERIVLVGTVRQHNLMWHIFRGRREE